MKIRLWTKNSGSAFPGLRRLEPRFCRGTSGLEQTLLRLQPRCGTVSPAETSSLSICTCGLWAAQSPCWDARVSPAGQHGLPPGLLGLRRRRGGRFGEHQILLLLSDACASSWQPSSWSTLGGGVFIGNVRLLGPSRCSRDEWVLGTQPVIPMFFF